MLFLLSLLMISSGTAHAATTQSFTSWTGVFAQGWITEKWGWFAESQSRIAEDTALARTNRLLLRAAARYRASEHLQLFAGYGWTPNLAPFGNENRFWQQALYSEDFGIGVLQGTWLARFRQEQRFIQNNPLMAHRSRLLLRATFRAWENETIRIAFWDEYFMTLNRAPQGGFDQNRIFIGPSFKLGSVAIEPGYMNVFTRSTREATVPNGLNQVFAVYIFVDFP